MLTTYSFNLRRSRQPDLVGQPGTSTSEEFNVILVLEQRSAPLEESRGIGTQSSPHSPIAPLLLGPEPNLRKCSPRACLRRLGVYVPLRTRLNRLGAAAPINPIANPP